MHRAIFLLFYALATVGVTYYLMPKFLYKKKYWQFFLGSAIVVSIVIVIEEVVLEPIIFPGTKRADTFPGVYVSLLGILPVMFILSGCKFGWDALKKQAQIENRLWSVPRPISKWIVPQPLGMLKTQVRK